MPEALEIILVAVGASVLINAPWLAYNRHRYRRCERGGKWCGQCSRSLHNRETDA